MPSKTRGKASNSTNTSPLEPPASEPSKTARPSHRDTRDLTAELLRLKSALDQRDCHLATIPSPDQSITDPEGSRTLVDSTDGAESIDLTHVVDALKTSVLDAIQRINHAGASRRPHEGNGSESSISPREYHAGVDSCGQQKERNELRPAASAPDPMTGPTRTQEREAVLRAMIDKQARLIHVSALANQVQQRKLEQVTVRLELAQAQAQGVHDPESPDTVNLPSSLRHLSISSRSPPRDDPDPRAVNPTTDTPTCNDSNKVVPQQSPTAEFTIRNTHPETHAAELEVKLAPKSAPFKKVQRDEHARTASSFRSELESPATLCARITELATLNTKLGTHSADLEAQLAHQSDLVVSRTTELETIKDLAGQVTEKMDATRASANKFREQGRAACAALTHQEHRAERLETQLDAAEEHQTQLEAELSVVERRLAVALLDVDTAHKQGDRKVQEEQLRAKGQQEALKDRYELSAQRLQAQLSDLTREVAKSQATKAQLDALRPQLDLTRTKRDAAVSHVTQMEQQLESASTRMAYLERDARAAYAACAQWEDQASSVQGGIDAMRKDLGASHARAETLQAAYDVVQQERDAAQDRVQELQYELDYADSRATEALFRAKESEHELERVKAALEATNAKLLTTDQAYWDTKEELATTQEELEDMEVQLESIQALTTERDQLRHELDAQSAATIETQDEVAMCQAAHDEALEHAVQKALATSRTELISAQTHITSLTTQLQSVEQELQHRTEEVEALHHMHTDLAAQVASRTESESEMHELIQMLEQELEAKALEIDSNDDLVLELKKLIKKQEGRLQWCRAERAQLRSTITSLHQQLGSNLSAPRPQRPPVPTDTPAQPAQSEQPAPVVPLVAGRKRPLPDDVDASPYRAAGRRHHVRTLCTPAPPSLTPPPGTAMALKPSNRSPHSGAQIPLRSIPTKFSAPTVPVVIPSNIASPASHQKKL